MSAIIVPEASPDGLSAIGPTHPIGCKSYFMILARTVFRVTPRITAVREMFHPVWARTSLRRWRSHSAGAPRRGAPRGDVPAGASQGPGGAPVTSVVDQ